MNSLGFRSNTSFAGLPVLLFKVHGVSVAHGDVVALVEGVVNSDCPTSAAASYASGVVDATHHVRVELPAHAGSGLSLCYNHGPAEPRHYPAVHTAVVSWKRSRVWQDGVVSPCRHRCCQINPSTAPAQDLGRMCAGVEEPLRQFYVNEVHCYACFVGRRERQVCNNCWWLHRRSSDTSDPAKHRSSLIPSLHLLGTTQAVP